MFVYGLMDRIIGFHNPLSCSEIVKSDWWPGLPDNVNHLQSSNFHGGQIYWSVGFEIQ